LSEGVACKLEAGHDRDLVPESPIPVIFKREPIDAEESDARHGVHSDAVSMCDVIVTNVAECQEPGFIFLFAV
jgi:hypothetical protein